MKCSFSAERRVARQDGAADDVTVAVEVLGRRVHDHRRAQIERALQHRGRERVVDGDLRAGLGRDLGDGRDVDDLEHRIGGRLEPYEARVGPHRGSHLCGVAHVHERSLEAPLLHDLVEDAERASVDVVTAEHVVAGLQAEQDRGGRRASAAERDAVLGAFERGEAALERGARRVAGARVVVLVVFAGRLLGEGARQDDGRHDGAVDRVRMLTRMNTERFEAMPFVLHGMPSSTRPQARTEPQRRRASASRADAGRSLGSCARQCAIAACAGPRAASCPTRGAGDRRAAGVRPLPRAAPRRTSRSAARRRSSRGGRSPRARTRSLATVGASPRAVSGAQYASVPRNAPSRGGGARATRRARDPGGRRACRRRRARGLRGSGPRARSRVGRARRTPRGAPRARRALPGARARPRRRRATRHRSQPPRRVDERAWGRGASPCGARGRARRRRCPTRRGVTWPPSIARRSASLRSRATASGSVRSRVDSRFSNSVVVTPSIPMMLTSSSLMKSPGPFALSGSW